MKVTVEISENDLREICRMTGLRKKGPALRQVLQDALRMKRRAEISGNFLSGEWSAELEGFEAAKQRDKVEALTLAAQWRD